MRRALRDLRQDMAPSPHPTTSHSLEDVGKLWADWGIHILILVSFGIQVFLFLAAGLRRRSVSRILRSLLWLAYLSADFVAVFILGHLSIHASGPQQELLFLWAPLVLLHLGGQYTMTAFSMQDNELWRRHLLGLVNQVVVAGYVVSRASWEDRRLLAAMALMFLSGCWRYAERTLCLYRASPAKLKESALSTLSKYEQNADNWHGSLFASLIWSATLEELLKSDGGRPSFWFHTPEGISSKAASLVSEIPLSDITDLDATPNYVLGILQDIKSSEHRCRVYNYVSTQLLHVYQHLYTKAALHYYIINHRFMSWEHILKKRMCKSCCAFFGLCPILILLFLSHLLAITILALLPFLSTSATLVVLLVVAKQSQLYSQADVLVSYILLIGAMTLEVASLFIAFAPQRIPSAIWCVTNPAKQWSEMLGQYNIIESLASKDTSCIMSFVPQWISNKTITHIPVYEDLKIFVLDKLLEFGSKEEDWKFARFRGQLALGKWLPPRSETKTAALHKSINDVDFPTSVLIWHIATDILYFQDNTNTTNSAQQQQQMKKKKKMSRELSNYIMYLVFKCGVMLTNSTELQHNNVLKILKATLHRLDEKDTMGKVFQAYIISADRKEHEIRRQKAIAEGRQLAEALIHIKGEVKRWELIATVWLEMLYYTAPRCGNAFHSEHLTTGGEFITHVLVLMQCLGPFLTMSYS